MFLRLSQIIMKCWCQTRDREKNQACGTGGLIIAAETVLFPPLTEGPSSHFYAHTHTEAQTDRHTHTGLAQSLNSNLIKPPQKPKQSGIKANPVCMQNVHVRACAVQM